MAVFCSLTSKPLSSIEHHSLSIHVPQTHD
uniref:Uncharacterized protein n=1 Tax=Anguilla anguilla TaxID=7936 RepID=A0A0E9SCA2_ANGAN